MLDIDREIIVKAIGTVAVDKQIVIEDINQDFAEFQENNKAVYLAGYHIAEKNLAARLKTLVNTSSSHKKD